MNSRIVFAFFFSILFIQEGLGSSFYSLTPKLGALGSSIMSETDICLTLSPNPADVTEFYEDNPTYVAPTNDPGDWQTGTPESQGLQSTLLQKGAIALTNIPQAFSFLVLRNNTLVFEQYFHGSSRNASNNVHSASKSLISGLISIAIAKGFLAGVDQSIFDILGEKFSMGAAKQKITIRDLLTHSSGYKWTEDSTEYKIQNHPNWVQAILNLPQVHTPGNYFNYATANTHLLSAVLTESTGMGTCEFANKYVFQPLGITFEHWGRDPQGYFSGGYNLYLRPIELMKLGQLYLQGGNWNGTSIIPTSWIQEAWQPQINVDSTYNYGYLFWLLTINGHSVYKMWGYGGQYVYIVPDLNLITVITSNTAQDYTEMDGDGFIQQYVLSAISN